jgi:hypothetical protein
MIDDIYRSITDASPTSLVILNCHGGNYVLANIVQQGNAHGKKMALFPSGRDWADARQSAQLVTSAHEDMHAGELETSILLHVNPELVRDGYQTADWIADDRRHLLTTGMAEYTQSGVIGRPSLASAEKGKVLLTSLVESFASVLEILQRALPKPRPSRVARWPSLISAVGAPKQRRAQAPEGCEPRQIRGNERLTALAALPRLAHCTKLRIAVANSAIECASQRCSTMIIRV